MSDRFSEETRSDELLCLLFATVLGDNPMKQERLYEISLRYMDEVWRRGIQIYTFSPDSDELRTGAYRSAIEDCGRFGFIWLSHQGFTSRMSPRAVRQLRTRPNVLTEEELLIACESAELAWHPLAPEVALKKASEVADGNLDGLPTLTMREGESEEGFALRLYAALHGENDLPRSS